MATRRRSQVHEKCRAHEGHDDEFLHQLVTEVVDRALDQLGAVVRGHDFNTGRQTRPQRLKLRLDRVDGLECVLTGPHDDDASDDFTLAIELGDAASWLRAELHTRNIGQPYGDTGVGRCERNPAEILKGCDIAGRANHVLRFAKLQG